MSKDNKTIYVILDLLNHEDSTGYDIKKRIHTIFYMVNILMFS